MVIARRNDGGDSDGGHDNGGHNDGGAIARHDKRSRRTPNAGLYLYLPVCTTITPKTNSLLKRLCIPLWNWTLQHGTFKIREIDALHTQMDVDLAMKIEKSKIHSLNCEDPPLPLAHVGDKKVKRFHFSEIIGGLPYMRATVTSTLSRSHTYLFLTFFMCSSFRKCLKMKVLYQRGE